MSRLRELYNYLEKLTDEDRAAHSQRFFKTDKGGYAEGDKFLGLTVPLQRKIAKEFKDLTLDDVKKLIHSKIHEHRLIALFILIDKYRKAPEGSKEEFVNFYLNNRSGVNNWDLVDTSASNILGDYLLDKKDRNILYKFAESTDLWRKRIAIISTLAFIRDGQFEDTKRISEILLKDDHDLIHKAVGWMLREMGKKDEKVLESFLLRHYKQMPRTMLRYAIEKFDDKTRLKYLKGEI